MTTTDDNTPAVEDAPAEVDEAPAAPPPPLPEVRQCQDPEDGLYGATAVAGTGRQEGQWLVAHPERGGHWATDSEVEGWEPPPSAAKSTRRR